MPVTKIEREAIRRNAEDELRCVAEDIQRSADVRVELIEREIAVRIEDAVEEALEWERSGEGDSIFSSGNFGTKKNSFGGRSIFEQYEQTINAGDMKTVCVAEGKDGKKKRTKYGTLVEAEWAAVGLAPYQDPKNMQTVEKLRLQQSASIFQYINYPIAHSEIENLKRYVLGRGVRVDCLVEPILKVVQNFWRQNKMEKRVKSGFQLYLLEGEYFPLLFDNYSGNFDPEVDTVLIMRSIPSSEIDEIEVDEDDRETRLSYKRVRVNAKNDIDQKIYIDCLHPYGDEKTYGLPTTLNGTVSQHLSEAEDPDRIRLMMFKHGLEYDLRGRVILESILRWNRVAVDFLYSRARLCHLRSKIYLVETRTGGSGKRRRSSASTERMPQGGMKLIETPDRAFRIVAPNTGADDAETDYKMLMYMIGSALSMPIHILQVNAENENYASIREAGNPFAQAVQDLQDEWGEHLRELLRYLVVMAVRKGVLKETYNVEYLPEDIIGEVKDLVNTRLKSGTEISEILSEAQKIVQQEKKKITMKTVNIPLSMVFPNIVQTDPTKEAGAVKIYMELGLMSKYTARLRTGLDPDVEESRINVEWNTDLDKKDIAIARFNNGSPDADRDAAPKNADDEDEEKEKEK